MSTTESPGLPITLGIRLDPNKIEEGAAIVISYIRKQWVDKEVKYKDVKVGFLNKVLFAHVGEDYSDGIVIRIFDNQFKFDLKHEEQKQATRFLDKLGFSPKLNCIFENGVCLDYVEGETYGWDDFSPLDDMKVPKAVVRELAKFHDPKVAERAVEEYQLEKGMFFDGFLQLLYDHLPDGLPESCDDEEAYKLWDEVVPSKEVLKAEIDLLLNQAMALNLTIVFCHNDANPTNVIYHKETDQATLIDYDVTAFGAAEYDLAVLLTMGVAGFNVPGPDCPRRQPEYWKEVLKEYLMAKRKVENNTSPVTEEEVDQLYKTVKILCPIVMMTLVMFCIHDTLITDGQLTPLGFLQLLVTFYDQYKNFRDDIPAIGKE